MKSFCVLLVLFLAGCASSRTGTSKAADDKFVKDSGEKGLVIAVHMSGNANVSSVVVEGARMERRVAHMSYSEFLQLPLIVGDMVYIAPNEGSDRAQVKIVKLAQR